MIPTLLGTSPMKRALRSVACWGMAMLAVPTVLAAPGDGVHLGSRISVAPALQIDLGYDTNVNRSNVSAISSGALSVRPSVVAKYDHEELDVQFSYEHFVQQYFASAASSYSYYDDLVGRLEADVLPKRRLGLKVSDLLSSRSYGYRSEYDNFLYGLIERSYNDLSLTGRYSPGPALDFNLGVRWLYNLENLATKFADSDSPEAAAAPLKARKNEFGLLLRGAWRFFPKTQLLAEGNYGYGTWKNTPECSRLGLDAEQCAADQQARVMYKSPVVQTWSFLTGVAGQVTNTIRARTYLGYGGLYNTDDPQDVAEDVSGLAGIIVQLGATYVPIETQQVTVAFNRRYSDSSIHDFFTTNGFSFVYSGMYFSRLQLTARVGLDFRNINSTEVASTGEYATRDDRVLYGTLAVQYKITRWLTASTSLEPTLTAAHPNEESAQVSPDPDYDYAEWLDMSFSYRKFLWIVGVRGTY